ncbi:hypothetical protein [Nonomuraea dietziae]|uniref:hypothetical protein n=1 Tax=Nonomuraea dietziae TaxID=65515 RepID=UPI0033FF364A
MRVLMRDPSRAPSGVKVAVGDLDRPASLSGAFAGVDTLGLLTAMGPQAHGPESISMHQAAAELSATYQQVSRRPPSPR